MSEPGKGTHWSNLISILGVGGKKTVEPAPAPVEEVKPLVKAPEADPPPAVETDLEIGWSKPAPRRKSPEPRVSEAKLNEPIATDAKTSEPKPIAKKSVAPAAAARPAPRPMASPKKKHWGSLAEQLGLPVADPEPEASPDDEPTWIEESENSGATLSGDDAADECVSHPSEGACAPEDCEVRSENCKLRGAPDEEMGDTRDVEYLDDLPASDEDLDALADMINESTPAAEVRRREPREEDDAFESERPRTESREPREEGDPARRRRRRRGRGRGRRDEAGDDRGPSREPVQREPAQRDSVREDDFDEFDDRPAARREDSDEDLDRTLRSRSDEDEASAEAEGEEGRREPRSASSREGGREDRRPRRRRRRRRGSEERGEGDRDMRSDAEPTDRIRGGDPEYRRKSASDDIEDDFDGDEEPASSHRNLPTWEDALSGIIGGNMENRARSPQPQYGNRGRGGGGRDRDRVDRGGGDRGGGDRQSGTRPSGDRGGRDRDRGSDRGPDRGPPRGRRDDRGGDRR